MDVALWIVQVLLALVFLMTGGMKLMQSREKLIERMPAMEDLTESRLKQIGILEVLGAIGLILPAATKILPILTPLAAVGLVLTMIGAAQYHQRRGETPMIGGNIMLLVLAAFVAYGRFVLVPL